MKSTIDVMTADAGIIKRGKYTLLIKFALPNKLLLASPYALEKNCHGRIPAITKSP